MELNELLTVGGISAVVLVLVQAFKSASIFANLVNALGALVPIALGVILFTLADISAGLPMPIFLAAMNGILAGATAAGIYGAATTTYATAKARAAEPTVSDYDPKAPTEGEG